MSDKESDNSSSHDLSEDDYSLMILKNRLAKGEISLDEFEILKKKLIENDSVTKLKDEIKNINEKMENMSRQSSTHSVTEKLRQYKIMMNNVHELPTEYVQQFRILFNELKNNYK